MVHCKPKMSTVKKTKARINKTVNNISDYPLLSFELFEKQASALGNALYLMPIDTSSRCDGHAGLLDTAFCHL